MDYKLITKIISLYAKGIVVDHWSREKMQTYGQKNADEVRKFACQNSPFYQRIHKGLESAPLNQLPPVTKKDLMSNFDELVTDKSINLKDIQSYIYHGDNAGKYLNKYKILTTSGSTGQPGIFLYDDNEWIHMAITFATAFRWAGIIINPLIQNKRVLIASNSHWHISTQLGITMAEMKMPGKLIPANQPLRDIIEQLNEFQPDEIIAYASMASILADEQQNGRLHINPKLIFTTSEVLTDQIKKNISASWNKVRIINKYAATETGCIAGECKKGNMHFLDQKGLFEVVDNNYNPVKKGQYGTKLLVTSFFHKTQPLIRYEISDSIKLATHQCKCGRPHVTIADLQGRSEQIIHLQGTKKANIQIHPVSFHHIMDLQPIQLWQLIQKKDNSIEVLIQKPHHEFSEQKLINSLTANLKKLEVKIPNITIRKVTMIPKEKSGKTPYIKVIS